MPSGFVGASPATSNCEFTGNIMKDMLGKEFKLGQLVAKPGSNRALKLLRVTKINDKGVFLGRGNNSLVYPQEVLILDGLDTNKIDVSKRNE